MTYKPGTVVQLKSGGPAMSVLGTDKEGLRCAWFSEKGEIHFAVLPSVCLDELILDDEDEEDED